MRIVASSRIFCMLFDPALQTLGCSMQGASVILNSPVSQAGLRGAFYQLAVELVAIETKVLLMDALRAAPLEKTGHAPQKAMSGEQCLHRSLAPAASRQAAFPAVSFSLTKISAASTDDGPCARAHRTPCCTAISSALPFRYALGNDGVQPSAWQGFWHIFTAPLAPAQGRRCSRRRSGCCLPASGCWRLRWSCWRLTPRTAPGCWTLGELGQGLD